MKVHADIVQGSAEWVNIRLGKVTASNADRILTPENLKPSAGQSKYIAELVTEWALNMPIAFGANAFMQRGSDLEGEARRWLAWEQDCDIQTCGFIESDDGLLGCSPDGIMPNGDGLEIKIYEATHHIQELLNPSDKAHKGQIQFSMMVTDRKYWTRLFWNPLMPCLVRRIEWDAEYIEAMHNELYREGGFLERLELGKRRLVELGFYTSPPCSVMTIDGTPCGKRPTKDAHGVWMCEKCEVSMEEIFS